MVSAKNAIVTVKNTGKVVVMSGKKLKKQMIKERIQLIDEIIDELERKIDSSFFVVQRQAIEQEIIRLNNNRKELMKKL